MAINRVPEPSNPPTAAADWGKIISEVRALALGIELPLRVIGSNIVKGAVFQIGGTVYLADADTAITGTASNYVKITPSGDGSTCAASFVSSLTGVAWNSTYCGWYDTGSPACFYEFDEGKAFTAGQIAAIRRNRDVTIPMGTGWLAVLAAAIGTGWAGVLAAAIGENWATALADSAGAGMLAQLLTVDGSGSGLDADTIDTIHMKIVTATKTWGTGQDSIDVAHGLTASKIRHIKMSAVNPVSANQYLVHPFPDWTDTSVTKLCTGIKWDATNIRVNKISGTFEWTGASMTMTFIIEYTD